MANGNWITGLTATTPVAEAARQTLKVRLEVVAKFLPLALKEPDKDPEHVHQLRVGTRRARAALDIFANCLPAKTVKAAGKQLRQIRRAAGEARDWDVFLLTLRTRAQRSSPVAGPGLALLQGFALAQRIIAQEHLETAAENVDLDKLVEAIIEAIGDPTGNGGPRTLLSVGQPMLLQLLHELDQAAAADLKDYENLH